MSSMDVDLSLDDIIKQNKKTKNNKNATPKNRTTNNANKGQKGFRGNNRKQLNVNKTVVARGKGRGFKLNRGGMYSAQMSNSPKKLAASRVQRPFPPNRRPVQSSPAFRANVAQKQRVLAASTRRAAELKRAALLRLNAKRRRGAGGDARDALLAKRRKIQILKTLLAIETKRGGAGGTGGRAGRAGRGASVGGRGGRLQGRLGQTPIGRGGTRGGGRGSGLSSSLRQRLGQRGARAAAAAGSGGTAAAQRRLMMNLTRGSTRGNFNNNNNNNRINNNNRNDLRTRRLSGGVSGSAGVFSSSFRKLDRGFGFRSDYMQPQKQTPQQQPAFRGRQGLSPRGRGGARGAVRGGRVDGWTAVGPARSAADLLTVKIENDKMGVASKAEKNRAKRERQRMNRGEGLEAIKNQIPPGYALVRQEDLAASSSSSSPPQSSSFPTSYKDYLALTAAAKRAAPPAADPVAPPKGPAVKVTAPRRATDSAKAKDVAGIEIDPGVFRNIGTGRSGGLSARFQGGEGGGRSVFM